VTTGPIYDIARIIQDPHVLERRLIADYRLLAAGVACEGSPATKEEEE